jgi:hypothetical protein
LGDLLRRVALVVEQESATQPERIELARWQFTEDRATCLLDHEIHPVRRQQALPAQDSQRCGHRGRGQLEQSGDHSGFGGAEQSDADGHLPNVLR